MVPIKREKLQDVGCFRLCSIKYGIRLDIVIVMYGSTHSKKHLLICDLLGWGLLERRVKTPGSIFRPTGTTRSSASFTKTFHQVYGTKLL